MSKFFDIKTSSDKDPKQAIKDLSNSLNKRIDNILFASVASLEKHTQRLYRYAEYDGNNDVQVYAVKGTNDNNHIEYHLKAIGTAVMFIEFGAGWFYNQRTEPHPLRATAQPPVLEIGEYGGHRGKDDYWVYKSNTYPQRHTSSWRIVNDRNGNPRAGYYWTSGNKPARAMYYATTRFWRELPKWIETEGK